jgi:hypothetical protein
MFETLRWEEQNGLRVIIDWDGEQYHALCREYDLTATGKTLNEARDALLTMMQHYLSLTDVQTWNEYFSDVQEEIDDNRKNGWASGDHVAN